MGAKFSTGFLYHNIHLNEREKIETCIEAIVQITAFLFALDFWWDKGQMGLFLGSHKLTSINGMNIIIFQLMAIFDLCFIM